MTRNDNTKTPGETLPFRPGVYGWVEKRLVGSVDDRSAGVEIQELVDTVACRCRGGQSCAIVATWLADTIFIAILVELDVDSGDAVLAIIMNLKKINR